VLLLFIAIASQPSIAAQTWGGSLGVTSDYLVRGISRSDHDPAIQADFHVAIESGLFGGMSVSSVKVSPAEGRSAELSAFVGGVWDIRSPWRAKILASHYTYPWSSGGSHYNYDELVVEAAYEEWFDLSVTYSPNAPRYLPYEGLIAVSEKTAELNLRTPWRHRLAATAGVGYSDVAGPDGAGYAYWSAGGMYDLAPWTFSLSYVSTNTAAPYLFYSAAAHDRWTATAIWRF
jgi:uncharacterized protein (TIGR02001 family)